MIIVKLLSKAPIIYLKLPEFQEDLNKWIKSKSYWKPSVKNQSLGFLSNGLIDRAITRDIDWGVEVPLKNYEKKKFMFGLKL